MDNSISQNATASSVPENTNQPLQSEKRSKFIPILLVILAVLLIATGCLFYFNPYHQPSNVQKTGGTNQQNSPTITIPSTHENTSSFDPTWLTVTSRTCGVSARYPPDWTIRVNSDDVNNPNVKDFCTLQIVKPVKEVAQYNFVLSRITQPEGSLEHYHQKQRESLTDAKNPFKGYERLDTISINGKTQQATVMETVNLQDPQKKKFGSIYVYFDSKSQIYNVIGGFNEDSKNVINQIITSISIIN